MRDELGTFQQGKRVKLIGKVGKEGSGATVLDIVRIRLLEPK